MQFTYEEVHLEVTARCNFHCPFCPLPASRRARGVMPLEQAREALAQIAAQGLAPRVAFHLLGEPLLHPHLGELLQTAAELELTTRVVTNGYLLAWPKPRRALRDCHLLDISLRAASAEEFALLSSQGSYPAYLAGLRDFLAQRGEVGSFQVRLRMFHSPHLAEVLERLGLALPPGALDCRAKATMELAPGLALLAEPMLDWRGVAKPFPARPLAACDEFEQGFAVLSDGSVTTCCWDAEGENTLGNFISAGGLTPVLGNDKAERFRRSFRRRRPPTDFCARCLGRPNLFKYLAYQTAVLLGRR